MGNPAPSDSVAIGRAVLHVGGTEEQQSLRILTRRLHQYREERMTANGLSTLTFSRFRARAVEGAENVRLPAEVAINDYCPYFPRVGILADFPSPDVSIEYLGLETEGDRELHRIRLSNSFASDELRAPYELGTNTTTEVWIDSATLLPRKLAYSVIPQQASNEPIPVEIVYAQYGNFGGRLYPTQRVKNFNGTLFAVIQIDQVSFNVGLTDADFPLQ
jgi:hypothetical protein